MDNVKNSKFWIAVTVRENGKYYSYVIPVTSSDNILSVLQRVKNLYTANIYTTKKQAGIVVTSWNESYKQNGTYLFDEPSF